MPQMADITIKKSDGTTDIIYKQISPSSGDKTPAVWRVTAASVIPQHRPYFTLTARDNGARDGRQLSGVLKYPVIVTENSIPVLKATIPLSFSCTLPTNVDALFSKEAAYQFGNLLTHALIRSCLEEMVAAS